MLLEGLQIRFNKNLSIYYILGVPGRDQKFDDRARNFESHACKLADTANMVATAGGCNNKHTVQEIFKTSNQVMLILTCSSLYTEIFKPGNVDFNMFVIVHRNLQNF